MATTRGQKRAAPTRAAGSTKRRKTTSYKNQLLSYGFTIEKDHHSDYEADVTISVNASDVASKRILRSTKKQLSQSITGENDEQLRKGQQDAERSKRSKETPRKTRNILLKVRENTSISNTSVRSLVVRLKMPKQKRKIRRYAAGFFENNKRFKFGWTPYEDFKGPEVKVYREVFDILQNQLKDKFNIDVFLDGQEKSDTDGPMHAANSVTVDAIVKTVMSQATNNDNATAAQEILRKRFAYMVNGQKVLGKVPNYHSIRLCPEEKLAQIIRPAGLHNKRAKFIKACLNTIYIANTKDLDPLDDIETVNPTDAPDFVPGLLSLDFLAGKSKNEIFNWLVKLEGVAVKTACCILAFNYKFPVFAVDTHVFRMCKWLRWIPEECNDADQACMHLDVRIPDELKFGLHQAFWHHGQKCKRCISRAGQESKGFKEENCPIEHLVTRIKVERRPSGDLKKKVIGSDDAPKTPKAKPTPMVMPFHKLTPEKAAEKGYILQNMAVSDNFDAPDRINITNKAARRWVLKELLEDDEDEENKSVSMTAKITTIIEVQGQGLSPGISPRGVVEDEIMSDEDSDLTELEDSELIQLFEKDT